MILELRSCINYEINKNYNKKYFSFFDIRSDVSRFRIRNFENRIRRKIVWFRNTARQHDTPTNLANPNRSAYFNFNR